MASIMIGTLVGNFRIFLIILVRVTALIMIAPLFSSQAFPRTAKFGFALFVSVAVFPWVVEQGYIEGDACFALSHENEPRPPYVEYVYVKMDKREA